MAYVKNPITYPTGKVSEDTAKINTNFSILADAFYNSDPENSPIYRACYVGITAPLNPKIGQIWVDTSVAPPVIKVYNGTNWLEVKPASVDEPSTPYVGQFWFDTTILPPVLKIYDGANWQVVNAPYEGNTAPSSPYIGQFWFDTSVNPPILKIYDGTNWQSNVSYANYASNANNANYANNADKLDGQDGSYYLNRANHTGTQAPSTISPQGSGSGLDADTVDGFHASQTPGPNVIVPLDPNGILDLSTTYVKSNVYSFRRVDLTNATSDYLLQVGEEAIIYFDTTKSTTKNLRIATQGGLYLIVIQVPYNTSINNSNCALYPNNQTYTNAITELATWADEGGSGVAVSSSSKSAFDLNRMIEGGLHVYYVSTYTIGKFMISWGTTVGSVSYGRLYYYVQRWNDTTTAWTSLGTIDTAGSSNGTLTILVRRLV